MCQACKDFKRATNLPKGAEFFHAAEKYLSDTVQQGKLPPETRSRDLNQIAQMIFESNVGSNQFQEMLERQLVGNGAQENLQEHTLLLKSVVDYRIKTVQFEEMLYSTTLENIDALTVKQLETVIWAMAKRLASHAH